MRWSASPFVKNVMARPSFPARPVRPINAQKKKVSNFRPPTKKMTGSRRGGGRTDSVDVASTTLREIIVDDKLDALEVDATRKDVCRDQAPDLALCEGFDDLVPLLLRAVGMDAVGVDAVEKELGREFLGAEDGLDEDEDGRGEGPFLDDGTQGEELVVLGSDELE